MQQASINNKVQNTGEIQAGQDDSMVNLITHRTTLSPILESHTPMRDTRLDDSFHGFTFECPTELQLGMENASLKALEHLNMIHFIEIEHQPLPLS
jgi:hypothetical protein